MRIWKIIGCLGLLAVIICGCILPFTSTQAYAEEENREGEQQATPPQEENREEQPQEKPAQSQQQPDNTATVGKTYSEGLTFRSNGDGTCAVAGIGSCTAACILIPPKSPAGDTVTEILPYAFSGGVVGAIELPATITALSAASFAGCSYLGFVRVASTSTAFLEEDGVLYSADGKTLLYCPVGRSAKELTLHKELRRIAAGAFADCPALTNVYFAGTTAEWHSIIVGDDNNALYAAKIHFE